MQKINLIYPIVGKIIGEKEKYVEIFEMESKELERLLKEISKFDYKFKQSDDLVTVEFSYQGKALFVECSFSSYKRLCDLYFKTKISSSEDEMQIN